MLTEIPKGPGIEVVSHVYSPKTHPDNGFGQTRAPTFLAQPRRDPYHGLSAPMHGWQGYVQRSRKGLQDAYINDNPRLSDGETVVVSTEEAPVTDSSPGFFSNVWDSIKSTTQDALGTTVIDSSKLITQTGNQTLTEKLTNFLKGNPSTPGAPSSPTQIITTVGSAAKSNPMTTTLVVGGAIAAGLLLLRRK